MYPENDTDFAESLIRTVKAEVDGGHSITREDGWSFYVQSGSPIAPQSGMVGRFYGEGIGRPVRGLFLDGVKVFYRTAAEDKQYQDAQLYGADASVNEPLAAVTTRDRHALVRPVVTINGERYQIDVRFRMLQPRELAGAQGFLPGYQFTGTKTEQVKQIGNAVPRRLARAIVAASIRQDPDVRFLESIDSAAKAA